MILGYSPTKNRSETKRRFFRKYYLTSYRNDILFRRSKNFRLYYTVTFWVFMLFSLRVGSVIFFSVSPIAYKGLNIILPEVADTKYFTFDVKRTDKIKIWVSVRHQIVINESPVSFEKLSEFIAVKKESGKPQNYILYIDRHCKMSVVSKLLNVLRKNNIKNVVLATASLGTYILPDNELLIKRAP